MPKISQSPLLQVKNLTKRFGGITAVNKCSFDVEKNSITGLIGPNGAGKTTMFDLITGLSAPDHGEISFKNENIAHLPIFKRARLGIGRTFQIIRVFPELKVIENILVTMTNNHETLLKSFFYTRKKQSDNEKRALEILRMVDLENKSHLWASQLSYGQQKLLEIVRAVSTGKELILLDEPAAGVNPTMLNQITNLIKELKQQGKTILLIEHNMNFVMGLCEKIIVMDYGKEIAAGTPEHIKNNPKVLEAYLGKKMTVS